MACGQLRAGRGFNPRSPRGGATFIDRSKMSDTGRFNPRSPRGGATSLSSMSRCLRVMFQSTLPTRGSDTAPGRSCDTAPTFQSTLPTRGSDDADKLLAMYTFDVSIHAPHEGERRQCPARLLWLGRFQSTLPTRGSDHYLALSACLARLFQSTLPTRGSDDRTATPRGRGRGVSIHAPHEGERPIGGIASHCGDMFQSTLPTRGSDLTSAARRRRRTKSFNPRSPRGGATAVPKTSAQIDKVSIHAPHEGERLSRRCCAMPAPEFQSTLPTRGSDGSVPRPSAAHARFNPRSPRGGATNGAYDAIARDKFQSTLPTRGSDILQHYICIKQRHVSIHAPHEGERQPSHGGV